MTLYASMKQVISTQEKARASTGLVPVVQSLLDLARAKAALALDTLRHYEDRYRGRWCCKAAGEL